MHAELFIRPSAVAKWRNGDVVEALSGKRIKVMRTGDLCSIKTCPFTRDGLRESDSLARWFREHTYQWRFDVASKTEVIRTELATGFQSVEDWGMLMVEARFSDPVEIPRLEVYLNRRRAHHTPVLFGEPGKEFWYGGRQNFNHMDRVWEQIRRLGPEREEDHESLILSENCRRRFFCVKTEDITEDEEAVMKREDRDPETNELIYQRVNKVEWAGLQGMTRGRRSRVKDPRTATDMRQLLEVFPKAIVEPH